MKTQSLHNRLERYLKGEATPAEARQIQTWLSCTTEEKQLTAEERAKLEMDILEEIKAYTAYPLFYPKKEQPWWRKIAAMF